MCWGVERGVGDVECLGRCEKVCWGVEGGGGM